jgi:lysophospholipase L1-like esterase
MKLAQNICSILMMALLLLGCKGGNMNDQKVSFQSLSEVPAAKWEKLASKKIYFGHQSVGYNILDGIKDIMKENPEIKLDIVESTDFESHPAGAFFHSRLGRNTDPKSKMMNFEKIMTSTGSEQIDLAFMKLCYVDITENSKPDKIFANYQDMLKNIRLKNNKTRIIHFTVPLTTNQGGIKAFIKKIIGKSPKGYMQNVKRYDYDQLLTSTFASTEPLFDLSKLESTRADGSRATFKQNGHDYFSLVPEYTSDGGHLNEYGRKVIAEKLLLFLVNQV